MLIPETNRFRTFGANANELQQTGVQWTLRVLFDDVEGGRYLLELDIMPSELPESSNVIARPSRRMSPDFTLESTG